MQTVFRSMIWPALLMSALSGCAQQAPATPPDAATSQKSAVAESSSEDKRNDDTAPSLPGTASLNNRTAATGNYRPIPPEVIDALLSLPTAGLQLPQSLLKQLLGKSTSYVVDIPRLPSRPDIRITSTSQPGASYYIWARSFQGDSAGVVGYLVNVSVSCKAPTDALTEEAASALRQRCAQAGSQRLGSGLRAYRIINGQPEDVTTTIQRPEDALGADLYNRYQTQGGGQLFLDDSRLDQAPVARWVMEFDPEQPLQPDANRAFDNGSLVHAGFLVWEGDNFKSHDTVPARLWPCPEKRPAECPADDRFVTQDK
ncbi:hypothetical protein [Xanthomonas campestris]|uniref:Lipoprotein n=1 Tax=Xanthomonas campestris pv. papavericola TaxID=487881 RepID=A0AAJ3CEG2_XANCA|nr:hypothetical protein [Xanthomonas campestris]MEC3888722.1 hypothetical protein [Xanthomonas campestris pv. papavericola]